MISGTDFIGLPTQDIERARVFYRDTLGLEESKQWGNRPAFEFETGSLTIAVMETEAFGIDFAVGANMIALHVDDFDAARSELEARGVQMSDTIDSGVCYQAYFKDPDGNTVGIHHHYAA